AGLRQRPGTGACQGLRPPSGRLRNPARRFVSRRPASSITPTVVRSILLEDLAMSDPNRRDFLRHSVGGGFALGSLLGLGLDLRAAQQESRRFKFASTREVPSVCPYCAVGCGQLVSVKDGK